MSFTIQLERNMQEKNEINKTPILIASYTGTLKTETSIVDPSILLECSLDDVADANYMTIPSFKRSYFITNITSVRTGLVQIDAHCDVLSSFKTAILSNQATIKRQETDYNLYTTDKQMKYFAKPIVTVKEFPNGLSGEVYVLSLAGPSETWEQTTWIVETLHRATADLYTTQRGGTGLRFYSVKEYKKSSNASIPPQPFGYEIVMGSRYFMPEWTDAGFYLSVVEAGHQYQTNYPLFPDGVEGELSSYVSDADNYVLWRTNVGYDTYMQSTIAITANSDPNDPDNMVRHELISNTDFASGKRISLPHPIKHVIFEWSVPDQ